MILLIGGGATLGAGILLVAHHSNQYWKIEVYNKGVDRWNANPPQWQQTAGDSTGFTVTQKMPQAQTFGNSRLQTMVVQHSTADPDDTVRHATSSLLRIENAAFSLRTSYADGSDLLVVRLEPASMQSTSLFARVPTERETVSRTYCEGCETTADAIDYCHRQYGPTAQLAPGNSSDKAQRYHFPSCIYTEVLQVACFVATVDDLNRVAAFHPVMKSCYYPFETHGDQHYVPKGTTTATNATVAIEIRAENDPFLDMQRLTGGAMGFGDLYEGRVQAGVCIVLGLLMILIPSVSFCCYHCCCCCDDKERRLDQQYLEQCADPVTHAPYGGEFGGKWATPPGSAGQHRR